MNRCFRYDRLAVTALGINHCLMSSKRSLTTTHWRFAKKPRISQRSPRMRCKSVETGAARGGRSNAAGASPVAGNRPVQSGADPPINVEVLPSPIKSSIDPKEYRVIRLPNGLTALLISYCSRAGDPPPENLRGCIEEDEDDDDEPEEEGEEEEEEEDDEEEENDESEDDMDEEMEESRGGLMKEAGNTTKYLAAASLTVGIGSFEDPMEIQGLMHFLEHMVFMGSEKYPKENAFDYYIKKHGGHDNAHTDMEHTTFYFEVEENHFYGGLDRFAQFFINPLMKKEAMTRERKAVHSEFQMALPEDACRVQQLFAGFAAENHPMGKFTWGNETTLNVEIPDEELHKKLHDLRLRFYSARNMTLALQSRHSLDVLQEFVCKIFSKVPDSGIPRPTYIQHGFPFPTEKLHRLYRVVPMKDYHSLEINWALPSLQKYYHTKPLHYISHLIGHEGRGSILSYLKKKVWAVGLYSGNDESGFEHNSTFALMSISVELTDEGFKNVDKVIEVVFQYLSMICEEGPVERIFNEIKQTEKINFEYAEEETAVENVENISENMQLYPPEDYLAGDCLLHDFNSEIIKECLSQMTPQNCNIMLSSKTYETEEMCPLKEKWFGTKYSVEDIPQEWEDSWNNLPINPELHMPSPNHFIPDNFDLLPLEEPVPEYPEKVLYDDYGELWFKQDGKFKLPRTYCNIYLLTDLLLQSPRKAALVDLYLNLIRQHIMEDAYPASMAQYSYSISATERGIVIKTNGFNQKLHELVDLVLHHMEKFEDYLDEKTFQEIRMQQMKSYHNYILKPANLQNDMRLSILQDVHWTAQEKLKEVRTVTSKDLLEEFASVLFPTCHFRVLVQGNTTVEQASNLYKLVSDRKQKSGIIESPFPELRTYQLQNGCYAARAHGFNPADTNSSVINYYQSDPGTKETEVLHEFIQMVMDEPAFDFLRTQEQLGYSVCCTNRNTFGILGLSLTVNTQANKFSVCHVDERIETFLTHFITTVENMSEEEMSTMKETLVSMKQTVDITLGEEVSRNWCEIVDGEYVFNRRKLQVELINQITRESTVSQLQKMLASKDNPSYRKLSVQVIGSTNPENGVPPSVDCLTDDNTSLKLVGPLEGEKDFEDEQFVKDIKTFKQQMILYPVTKIL
ncbi:nardilysin-like [Palaemon carinicauda]|uniref:nardilysin-like n=1 Tax=Palaemon carinicauda TaxID=392227 RepID=UPI0035B693D1